MSRVMGVRNDEELKNQRKIGIVGVRYLKTSPGTRLTNTMRLQSLNHSLWAGIPCKPVASSIGTLMLTASSSPCRV